MILGLIGTSLRENEKRLALHPRHLPTLPPEIRQSLVLEAGYGRHFNVGDAEIGRYCAGLVEREELLATADVVVLAKPMERDIERVRQGGVLCGWLHFVLYGHLADIAIERRLTVLTWEAMYESRRRDGRRLHTFFRNNELAGYGGVLHALGHAGIDGRYGPPRKVVVLGYGHAGQAAVTALRGIGLSDITVCSVRDPADLPRARRDVRHLRYAGRHGGGALLYEPGAPPRPLLGLLQEADIIINCSVQDPEDPVMFVAADEVAALDHRCVIIDISCDPGMGFPFLRTTTFERPCYQVGAMTVYAVDHTPGYLWDAASWEISKAFLPYLGPLAGGPSAWQKNRTLREAIEIENGVVCNPKILSYQNRSAEYPHRRLDRAVQRQAG